MSKTIEKALTRLAPVLGAGAVGVCPLCWIGSASLLTYLGLGALIPVWRWLAFGLIAIGAVGFLFDYRAHKNPRPLILLVIGVALLYVGRYVFLSTWGAWQIWGPGAIIIIVAIAYNKRQFKRSKIKTSNAVYQFKNMDQKDKKTTCTACSCSCQAHQEHNHLVDGGKTSNAKPAGTCRSCGTQNGSTCGCN
ncbi:MerC domain-containing protein [Candidatus Uhrbacteria bacterium]|nr:MerC domain-containing protein [Candidatus Uhrbacteria bacterium]